MHIDFETYSEVDLKKVGAWAYSQHPSTEIIFMSYAFELGEVKTTEKQSHIHELLYSCNERVNAWNSSFEQAIAVNVLGISRFIDPHWWSDTAARAAVLGLPRSLDQCCKALQLPGSLSKEGKALSRRLITRYTKPDRKGLRQYDGEGDLAFDNFLRYGRQDVIAERAISQVVPHLTWRERRIWELTDRINSTGLPLDIDGLERADEAYAEEFGYIKQQLKDLTGVGNPNSNPQMITWLGKQGVHMPDMRAATVKKALASDKLADDVREALELKQQLALTAPKKFWAMRRMSDNGRAYGALKYYGAGPGRWSSQGVNFQNLARPAPGAQPGLVYRSLQDDNFTSTTFVNERMVELASAVRGAVKAGRGMQLIVGDYSSIEARVLAWISDNQGLLDVFRTHGMAYEHTASGMFKVDIDKVSKEQRFLGKVATLACGYQGGTDALNSMAELYGIEFSKEASLDTVEKWRSTNKPAVRLWRALEQGAVAAVDNIGKTYMVGKIRFLVDGHYLKMMLPSGRPICYYRPHLKRNRFDKMAVHYWGVDAYTRQYKVQSTYGGKLTENACQGIARDVMAEGMLELDKAGYNLILTVHDEIVSEDVIVPDAHDENDFKRIMDTQPKWAAGLPIASEVFTCKRYQK